MRVICLVNDSECGGDKRDKVPCLSNQLTKNANKSRFSKARTEFQAILYQADTPNELNTDSRENLFVSVILIYCSLNWIRKTTDSVTHALRQLDKYLQVPSNVDKSIEN